jgi:hypothetical protein
MKSAVVGDCGGFGRFLCCSVIWAIALMLTLGGVLILTTLPKTSNSQQAVDTIPTYSPGMGTLRVHADFF